MLDMLFGWRKASKCKKLIKRIRCRLKLLRNKRFAIAKQLREDIAQLLKGGHEQIAFNRLEQLFIDEKILSLYELLDLFSEFIILNMSYIRKHKDTPNDIKEAISTLIYASARCSNLPELTLIRKLFEERYGKRLVTTALEWRPGNLVNCQVKEKLVSQPVPEDVKCRLLDEIVRDYFFKPGPLALEYKPSSQKPRKVNEVSEVQEQDKDVNTSTNCSNLVQSSTTITETMKEPKVENFAQLIPYEHKTGLKRETVGYSSESMTQYFEESVIYLDDVEEFESPTNRRVQHCMDQEQRYFVLKSSSISKMERQRDHNVLSYSETTDIYNGKIARKRMRRRSVSREKQRVNDAECEIYYGNRPHNRRKYQKKFCTHQKTLHACDCAISRHQCNGEECYDTFLWREKGAVEDIVEYHVHGEDIEEMGLTSPLAQTPRRDSKESPLMRKCWPPPPYIRAVTMPQRSEKNLALPRPSHVHPKLPDYDEIVAKFIELKKNHHKCAS